MAETPLKVASMKEDCCMAGFVVFWGCCLAGFVVVTAGKSEKVVDWILALWIKN